MPNLDAEAIGARIALARKEAGLHQRELAERIGVIPRSVQNYEAGRIPWKLLDAIAAATGRTKEWLLYGDAEIESDGGEARGGGGGGDAEVLKRIESKLDALMRHVGATL